MLEVSIIIPKENLFCSELVSYEVRTSCKGPFSAALYVYCYLINQFYVFQTTVCGYLHSEGHITSVTDSFGVIVNISPFEQ